MSMQFARLRDAAPPAFLIGQDARGAWLAIGGEGRESGIFTTREAALKFAASETGRRAGSVRETREPLSLWR